MQFEGMKDGTRDVTVHLPASDVDLTLRVRPLPWGLQQKITRTIRPPTPPSRKEAGRKGQPVLVYNEQDADYRAKLAEVLQLQTLVMLRYALAEDTTITWDAPFDPEADLLELAKATEAELDRVSFPMGDCLALIKAVIEASGIDIEEVERTASDFSRTGIGST